MRVLNKEEIEFKLFRWLLIVGIPFWFHRVVRDLMIENPFTYLGSDLFFLVSTSITLYCLRYKNLIHHFKILYCTFWIVGFVYYWHLLGGISGPMTYVFFSVMAVFIGFIPDRFKIIFALVMCGTAVLLALDATSGTIIKIVPLPQQFRALLGIDYVVNSVIVAVAMVSLKITFNGERKYIERQNKELTVINEQLNKRNRELALKSQEIKNIKSNLETLIQERTLELKSKNELLAQYAYDNAHIVRRPLTNIQGLLDVLELENTSHHVPKKHIRSLRTKLGHLDEITRKINLILN